MNYLKISKHKYIYVLALIGFLLLIYYDLIHHMLTFNVNDVDLTKADGMYIRNSIALSKMNLETFRFNVSSYKAIVIPLIIAIVGKEYNDYNNKLIKLNIGKNNNYYKENLKCKLQLSLIPVIIYVIVVVFGCLVAYLSGGFYFQDYMNYFDSNSILGELVNGEISFIFTFVVYYSIYIYLNCLFCLKIIDFINNYIRGVLIYLGFLWLLSIAIYSSGLSLFAPVTTFFLFTYGPINMINALYPWLLYLIVYILMRFKRYEF